MKKWMKGLACLAVASALAACGKQGNEYVGNWQAKEHTNRTATIERNGDNFVIKVTEPSVFERNKLDTEVLPAVYKDGMLEVSGIFGSPKISYVKDTDTLLMPTGGGSIEYRRVK
jgi:predicted small lipoprotein YifL